MDNYDHSGNRIADMNFWYHSGVAENGGTWWPDNTTRNIWPLPNFRLDHVVSNFAYGSCHDISFGSGMDHKANECTLYFYQEVYPVTRGSSSTFPIDHCSPHVLSLRTPGPAGGLLFPMTYAY